MEKQWKEEYLLKLVETVTEVEDNLTRENTRSKNITVEEEKWEQVAAKMPFSILIELNYLGPIRYGNFPSICKSKFIEICEYFNDVFMKSHRDNCLTKALMKILAEYSIVFLDQPFVSKTGPQVKYIKIDCKIIEAAADSAGSGTRTDCSSRVRDCSSKLSRPQIASNRHDSLHFRNSGQQESTVLVVHTPFREPQQVPLDSDRHGSLVLRHARQQGSTTQIQAPEKQRQQGNFNEMNSEFEQVEFVKKMSRSQVVRGYLLTLPSDFCNTNLSQYQLEKRVPFVLVDEDSVTWRVQYIPNGHRVSGGWIAFAKKHRLQVDDILRFRLIKSRTFQVGANTLKLLVSHMPNAYLLEQRNHLTFPVGHYQYEVNFGKSLERITIVKTQLEDQTAPH